MGDRRPELIEPYIHGSVLSVADGHDALPSIPVDHLTDHVSMAPSQLGEPRGLSCPGLSGEFLYLRFFYRPGVHGFQRAVTGSFQLKLALAKNPIERAALLGVQWSALRVQCDARGVFVRSQQAIGNLELLNPLLKYRASWRKNRLFLSAGFDRGHQRTT